MQTPSELVVPVIITLAFLIGIRLMHAPRIAVWGNRLGAASMAAAIALAALETGLGIAGIVYLVVGAVLGVVLGQNVRMIRMPQTVALFNGLGGGASAIVAGSAVGMELLSPLASPAAAGGLAVDSAALVFHLTAATALGIGVLTFCGSAVAALKLHGTLSSRPFSFRGFGPTMLVLAAGGVALLVAVPLSPGLVLLGGVVAVYGLYGILMALRIGGADMPVVISLLNSLSGLAAAVSGFAVGNPLLAGVGAIVGVAGLILTRVMCRAMNRSLTAVLGGFLPKPSGSIAPAHNGSHDISPDGEHSAHTNAHTQTQAHTQVGARDLIPRLREARSVVFVPGYGMALAQAQQAVRALAGRFEQDGKEVAFGIHPVAGRMPGHMNVLLAESGVSFDKMLDMAVINERFTETDVAIVVGACDVVNPAAATAVGTPIYGMPVLRVADARTVVVCNLDEKPGYSGVANSLYAQQHVITRWGDAAATVAEIAAEYRRAAADGRGSGARGSGARGEDAHRAESADAREAVATLRAAKRVTLVPGYGLARSQGQEALKALVERLESDGKEVRIAIHPYAGRILGHIPFLLGDVGVSPEKFVYLSDAAAQFRSSDVVIVVGANDIVNPDALPSDRSRIPDLPAFSLDEAASVVVCTTDAGPGFEGVENPLFALEKTRVIHGDAADTLGYLTEQSYRA